MSSIATIVISYIYFGLIGAPLSLLCPQWLRRHGNLPVLAPVFGFATLSAICPFIILLAPSIDWLWMAGAGLAALGFGLTLWIAVKRRELLKGSLNRDTAVSLILFLAAVYLGMNPSQRLSTIYINGIDVGGYGTSATYLRTWTGYEALEKSLTSSLGVPDVEQAKDLVHVEIDLQLQIASEFILKAYRWSFSAILAATANMLGEDSVYRLIYVLLGFLVAGLFIACVNFAGFLGMTGRPATLLGLCVVLNCNMLNTAVQGQFAQVLAAPVFLMCLLWIFNVRAAAYADGARQSWRESLFFAIAIGSLMPLYNEMVFAVVVFSGLLFWGDIWFYRMRALKLYFVYALPAFALGLLIAAPISVTWLNFLSRHLVNIKIGGWPQPHWAYPAEFFGLVNMYSGNFVVFEVPRLTVPHIAAVLFTFLLIPLLIKVLSSMKRAEAIFFTVPWVFIAVVFVKTYHFERIHNYEYMKAYTFFLPVITVGFGAALWMLAARKKSAGLRALAATLAAVVLFSGGQYYYQAKRDGRTVTEAWIALKDQRELFAQNLMWIQATEIDQYVLAGIVPVLWLNRWGPVFLGSHVNDKISVLLFDEREARCSLPDCGPGWRKILGGGAVSVYQSAYLGSNLTSNGLVDVNGLLQLRAPWLEFNSAF